MASRYDRRVPPSMPQALQPAERWETVPDPPASKPPGVRPSACYVPEIESLRGIAILLVVLYHGTAFIDGTRGLGLGHPVSPLRAFVYGGHTGVTLFFVLSAFLLSQPFLAEAAGAKRVVRSQYFARRALRILPLYWVVVLATSVALARHARELLRAVPYMLFLNSFPGFNRGLAPLNSVWWSLATEVQFYLFLPLLPLLLVSRRRRRLGCVALLVYAVAYAAALSGGLRAPSLEAHICLAKSLFGCAPLFAVGVATAWAYGTHGEALRRGWSKLGCAATAGDLALVGVLVGLGYLLRYTVVVGYWPLEISWPVWHVLEGILWGVVVFLMLIAPLHVKPVFSNRTLRTLGVWSYSIYLLHMPILYLSERFLHFAAPGAFRGWTAFDIGKLALVMGVCIAASGLTYRAIERPFLLRKSRLDP